MRTALLVSLPAGMAAAGPQQPAHPVTATAITAPLPAVREMTSRPLVRIRGFGNGLGRADFALWLGQHPGSDPARASRPPAAAGITAMLNSTSIEFARADSDRNGRVSGWELASLILQSSVA